MKVSVFGLGYVGCVSAACFARSGHDVVGVDVNEQKVGQVNAGHSPVLEAGLDELVKQSVQLGRLRATTDGARAARESDASIICVGTPSNGNGSLNLDYVRSVAMEIGRGLAERDGYHVVVVRSTVLPGTLMQVVLPLIEEQSGRSAGADFGLCMNPEFLRESSAIADFFDPSVIVVGELDPRSGDNLEQLYAELKTPVTRTSIATAELVKYANNAFHATKIAFANEVGSLCSAHEVDGQEVMSILCQDHRLNISPAYLRPGFAFGGSCLPKDLRALLYRAKERDVDCPLLGAVLPSNQLQIQRAIQAIEGTGAFRIGVLGLSFKSGTDDVRESPVVPLVETLLGRGYQVAIFDESVRPDQLVGANRSFLERALPHIASLMRPSIDDLVDDAEVVVIANASPAFRHAQSRLDAGKTLIDLTRPLPRVTTPRGLYASHR